MQMNTRLIELLRERVKTQNFSDGIVALYIYGSILKGTLRKESDIDVGMLPSYKVSMNDRLNLIARVEALVQSILKDSGYNNEISVLDMRGKYTSIPLLFHIITEGALIYDTNKEERVNFENAVKGEYFDLKPYIISLTEEKYEKLLEKTGTDR